MRLGIVLAGLLAVAPVQAASFASASLSDFRITLFDVNTTDGISPGVTFHAYQYDTAFASVRDGGGNRRTSFASGAGPSEVSVKTAVSSARAAVKRTRPTNVTSAGAPQAPFGFASEFSLTPSTGVSFSALGNVHAATIIVIAGFESANTAAQIFAHGSGQFALNVLEVDAFDAQSKAATGVVTVSFTNLSGSDLVGQWGRGAFVREFSAVEAMREPETYAMMLAGLGLFACMVLIAMSN